MSENRWTDAFLDEMRKQGDPKAQEALDQILKSGEVEGEMITDLFRKMNTNDDLSASDTFPALYHFFEGSQGLPDDVDLKRVHHGEDVFAKYAYDAALALLCKSLPEGYQAPVLAKILSISGNLEKHTYRRLLATLQTVVNVSTCHGFEPNGRAVITAQKLRLLHAGVRYVAQKYLPEYETLHGVPVNQEDMLGTVVAFSLLVIEGWERLGLALEESEKEDYLYLWMTFARMMGLHPPYEHQSQAFIPSDLADARAFYAAYTRRHYVEAEKNAEGVALARANIKMLASLVPTHLRFLGFGLLPQILMYDLMGAECCARLAIAPVRSHRLTKWFLTQMHRLLTIFEYREPDFARRFSLILLQGLIDKAYRGQVTFTVPTNLPELREMIFLPGGEAKTSPKPLQ